MKRMSPNAAAPLALAIGLVVCGQVGAQEASSGDTAGGATPEARLDALQSRINQQSRRIEELRDELGEQTRGMAQLQAALNEEILANARARGAAVPVLVPSLAQGVAYAPQETGQAQAAQPTQQPPASDAQTQAVGQAPESDSRPPEVAQIFDQPGALTPAGTFVLEPSLQYGYTANDRVVLVGYTVIPAILIGLIDVRQVKTTTAIATMTGRYGLNNRLELEFKVPYVYASGDTVSREIFTGSALDRVFNSSGRGLGDMEMSVRYQFNRGGPDKAFYVGWLRYKSRSGTDIFDVVTDCVTRCVANATGTGLPLELPMGSGFDALQPGITWLYPSDPVVFFGSFSYLYNFERTDVSRTVIGGEQEHLGDVKAGDIWGFNVGLGLALNEKASISLGYDQSMVGKTTQNGEDVPGSVRVTLGTLLLGGTYRFNDHVSLNVALGAGVTRDTPDLTLTTRVPITF
ncbi:acetate kinase [Pseudoxanthomonas daejeonensis]|uniref:acetate kinase n=1 Tax=Pseudoxanthomonas daejeonensis TaxID=266062 RepID=UPI00192E8F42|nr:acetate kinase [Pseudoxanthomonas daejeonensis]UNK58671.1 acetate kinase [Pseudoxanthomonas daejeonensis]